MRATGSTRRRFRTPFRAGPRAAPGLAVLQWTGRRSASQARAEDDRRPGRAARAPGADEGARAPPSRREARRKDLARTAAPLAADLPRHRRRLAGLACDRTLGRRDCRWPRRRSHHHDGGLMATAVAPVRSAPPAPADGLTVAEAAQRLALRGRTPRRRSSRSYASIVRANVFTVFNLILAVAGAATLAFGEWQDALFLGVLVSNTGIGIVQEVRAKRALDRLSELVAPQATVVREGTPRALPVAEVVVGDLLRLAPGDQVVADGQLTEADALRLDEAILTGEAEPVAREVGDEVRSGSFAVEGIGAYIVSAVGSDSYAARLTGEARSFRHPRSPLELALNRLLFVLVGVLVPLGVVLGYALWHRHAPLHTAVPTSVAAVVTLVPEGRS